MHNSNSGSSSSSSNPKDILIRTFLRLTVQFLLLLLVPLLLIYRSHSNTSKQDMALLGRVGMVISRTSRIPSKDQCPTQFSNNRFSSSYNNNSNNSNRLLNLLIIPIRPNLLKLRRLSRNPFKLRRFSNNQFKVNQFKVNLLRFNMLFSNLLIKRSLLNNLIKLSHFNNSSHFLNPSRVSRTSFLNLIMSSRFNSCLSKHSLKRSKRKPSPRLRFRRPLFLIPSLLSLKP